MKASRNSPLPLLKIKYQEKGKIKDIKKIIVRITGLPTCLYGQIVDLGEGVSGMIMGFDEENVLALVLGDPGKLKMGREVVGISEPFKIPVGDRFIGRMLTAMVEPCDNKGAIEPSDYVQVFKDSAPITHRGTVNQFLPTGTKIVDILVPVAKGQRELILGDRMTGKTVIAMDAILNQKGKNVVCIYCAVGKSVSALEKVMTTLNDYGALEYSMVMVATDSSPVGEQYIVPFAAASMGEYFARKGRDVLVIFDDLTKHAWAYRQLSLLLNRPPGREAYPGDIFYVQTQLMERAGKLNEKHGNGSMTFLGIAETQQGDLTGYIPSNLASMCDGQVCMSNTAFAEGVRPAIDMLLSLSIVGGRAQPPILKDLSMNIRADYARYAEVARLSKLQSGLSGEAERVVKRGLSIRTVLQQGQYKPVSLVEEVLLLYALQKNMLFDLSDAQRLRFAKEILGFAEKENKALLDEIDERRELTGEIERGLTTLLESYLSRMGEAPESAVTEEDVEKT